MGNRFLCSILVCVLLLALAVSTVFAGGMDEYEGRLISSVEVAFEGSPADPAAQAEFLSILRVAPNTQFSAVRVRDSLQALFDSGRVANARVEVTEEGPAKTGPVRLRFAADVRNLL